MSGNVRYDMKNSVECANGDLLRKKTDRMSDFGDGAGGQEAETIFV